MFKKFVLGVAAALACVASAEDIDWTDRAVRRQAVLETAYAYYLKADCVQYDSTPLMLHRVGVMSSRRTKEGTPEDATPDKTYYTVCSSFPYETYWNALGYRLGGSSDACYTMALTTRPQEAVVFEYDKRRDRDGSKYVPEMMRMRDLLEPGDVIVYTTFKEQKTKTGTMLKGGGHALMYVGDVAGDGHNKVMHSGGAKYQFEDGGYDQVEWSGTIRLDDMDAIFFHGARLKKKTKIMVFRPLQLPASKYPLTDSAKARYLHPRLRCDRRAEVGVYGSVVSGGTLGYSITLKNFSQKAYVVPVREKVPDGAEFLPQQSMGGLAVCDGKTFGWDIPLAPGEERVVTWRVRVTAPAGSRIVATGGTAAGIPSNTIETDVVPSRMSAACARAWAQANVHDVTALPDCRVRAWAGGRRNPDPPRGVRVADPHARHLMEGDVVVVCRRLSKPKDFRLWTMGRGGLEEMTPHGIRWVTDAEVESLLAADFFAALRPASLPGVAEEWNRRQQAVVATAFAYHRKREFVQTCPTGAEVQALNYKPTFGEPPEAAGQEHVLYHNDLSFVSDVFRNTIGYALCADPANTSVSNFVEAPPPGTLVFAYDRRKDPGQKRFWDEMARMWSLLEPGDVVAIMSDGPDLTGKRPVPPVNAAMLFVGDPLGDGHAQKLMVTGDGGDAADPLGRLNGAINKSMFDAIQHGRSRLNIKNRTKIVVLRPLQLPAAKWPLSDAAKARVDGKGAL